MCTVLSVHISAVRTLTSFTIISDGLKSAEWFNETCPIISSTNWEVFVHW